MAGLNGRVRRLEERAGPRDGPCPCHGVVVYRPGRPLPGPCACPGGRVTIYLPERRQPGNADT